MAKFEGDIVDGVPLKANSTMTNFWYDLTFQESKNVWKDRNEMEQYFRTMMYAGIVMAAAGGFMASNPIGWGLIGVGATLGVIKYRLLQKSKKKTDHR